ncbi:MAG: hypothetical protein ACLRFE_01280 [Clostridia bacterium]
MNKEPKIQFSKILTVGSLILFTWSLLQGFITDFTQMYDTTIYVTAISISGGIFGVCLKAYMSKSKAENIYKVQKSMYEDIMDIKLKYNENMMKLTQQYNMTQSDIDIMDSTSPIDEGVDSIINDMRENINNHLYDTKTEDEIENY